MKYSFVASALVGLCFFCIPAHTRAATVLKHWDPYSTSDWHLTKEGSPYIIQGDYSFPQQSSFIVDPGVVIKLDHGASLSLAGWILVQINGTKEEPVVFTSIADDSHGGDTNEDGSATTPQPGDWKEIYLGEIHPEMPSHINYARFLYGGGRVPQDNEWPPYAVSTNCVSNPPQSCGPLQTVEVAYSAGYGIFAEMTHGYYNTTMAIANSSIHDNALGGLMRLPTWNWNKTQETTGPIDVSGNWWGDASGPYEADQNSSGLGNAIATSSSSYPITFAPWLTENPFPELPPEPVCTLNCNDNVLFLPGIEGSRLYKDGTRLWDAYDVDTQALALDASGNSVDPTIYTKDAIDTFNGWPLVGEVYGSFLHALEDRKNNDEFADYAVVPYDWRLAIDDIVANGKETGDGINYNLGTSTPYLIQTLRHLAVASRTGKVAIVAHSNGGLVAKHLVNVLGAEAPDLIGQIIFVAVPQLGTPQAIGALLNGYDIGIPFVMDADEARKFALNAPMTYQLLPSGGYFTGAGATISTPVVSFENGSQTQSFINVYGPTVDGGGELQQFLVGAEGRTDPAHDDLESPELANARLLADAEALMQRIGASWTPPDGIAVHQIAGVGEDTLAGITYKTIRECTNTVVLVGIPVCFGYADTLSYTPNLVTDGDGTVVAPSALAMSDLGSDVDRWWVDLKRYNDGHLLYGIFRESHRSITSVQELRDFVFSNLLEKSSTNLPNYVSSTEPIYSGEDVLRYILHSPLTLSATDALGNSIGADTATIPGATYARYGEVQVVTVPAGSAPTVRMEGVADGSFTLEVQEYAGNSLVATTTFSGIPSTEETVVTMAFPDDTIAGAGDLALDYDGNGSVDETISPEAGEEVQAPVPTIAQLLTLLRERVQQLDVKKNLKTRLLNKINSIEKKIAKQADRDILRSTVMQRLLERLQGKGKIPAASADSVLAILESLEAQIRERAVGDTLIAGLKDTIARLDIRANQIKNMVKRVDAIATQNQILKKLERFAAMIVRVAGKGKLSDVDAQDLLQLLNQIESSL